MKAIAIWCDIVRPWCCSAPRKRTEETSILRTQVLENIVQFLGNNHYREFLFYLTFWSKNLVTNYPAGLYGRKGHDLRQPEELNSEVELLSMKSEVKHLHNNRNRIFCLDQISCKAEQNYRKPLPRTSDSISTQIFSSDINWNSSIHSRQLRRGRSSQANTRCHVYFIWVKHSYWR